MTGIPRPGADYLGDGTTRFTVWAPAREGVAVVLIDPESDAEDRVVELHAADHGYYTRDIENVGPGQRYKLRIDDWDLPDPASKSQPGGVHAASEVIDAAFEWNDAAWKGVPLRDYVIYELHVGTFTEQGTFDAVIPHLDYLKATGITAVEIMPVSQFPGGRNWGYDGVQPYAAQDSYGGIDGLRRLVDACHRHGIAIVLDVVYNHMGPEGNYTDRFGPYFTAKYATPWGGAMNFDDPGSDDVRHYFIENALWWLRDCHFDALRLDAVHAILDHAPYSFIEELADRVAEASRTAGREMLLVAESSDNDVRLTTPRADLGYGMHGVWADDLHHCLHALLTGESQDYYVDYTSLEQLAKVYREAFAYTGEYSLFRGRRHGTSVAGQPAERFVVAAQNHDQIGNRAVGDRLTTLVSPERQRLAAAAVLLSPYVPLLFMGEEYGETRPFPYFISHGDPDLVRAVREGRKREFEMAEHEPLDPDAIDTYRMAKLDLAAHEREPHATTYAYYRALLDARRSMRHDANVGERTARADEATRTVVVEYDRKYLLALSFADAPQNIPLPRGTWHPIIDSGSPDWGGTSPATIDGHNLTLGTYSAVLLRK